MSDWRAPTRLAKTAQSIVKPSHRPTDRSQTQMNKGEGADDLDHAGDEGEPFGCAPLRRFEQEPLDGLGGLFGMR